MRSENEIGIRRDYADRAGGEGMAFARRRFSVTDRLAIDMKSGVNTAHHVAGDAGDDLHEACIFVIGIIRRDEVDEVAAFRGLHSIYDERPIGEAFRMVDRQQIPIMER